MLAGCATPYQHQGLRGGFSDNELAPDSFFVAFYGNAYTSAERAHDFVLLRACDLTLQNGYAYFAVVRKGDFTQTAAYTTPGHIDTTADASGYDSGNIYLNSSGNSAYGGYDETSSGSANAHTTFTPPETHYVYRPESGLVIQCFTNKPATPMPMLFNADSLQHSLREKYKMKLPKNSPESTTAVP